MMSTAPDLTNPSELQPFSQRRVNRVVVAAILFLLIVVVVYERLQGRIWWCACGKLWPISLHVNSMHNSQHLLDAYSLSHVLHGLLFYGLIWLIGRRFAFGWRLVAATAVEAGWEMMENSPLIINRYRAATVSLGYTGDSIANSISDILCFMAGFYLARRVGWRWSIAIFVLVELMMLYAIRDNLSLNILMLLWPIDAIRKWQAAA